jgi:L-ascorbate metabolism protein UlaG (beta-lactamase superfamily)
MTTPTPASDQMTVRFMGTSTLSFDDGATPVLIDGFFSRPPITSALVLAPNEARIDDALQRAEIGRLEAVFVAHSHYDHAMDSARVAKKTGAVVVGSASTANIARGEGFPEDRLRIVQGDSQRFAFGALQVTVLKTPHTPDAKFEGTIDRPLRLPARVFDYREGGSYSFLIEREGCRILVVPSTSYTPTIFEGVRAHVVFLGIATLAAQPFVEDWWRRAVLNTGATLVVPVHWDDFTRPLHEPLRPLFRPADDFDANMKALIALAERDKVELRLPLAFTPIALPRDAQGRTICRKAFVR